MVLINDNNVVNSNQSGAWPYTSVGPIDFSSQNFVYTCQTDYYYDASSTGQLDAKVLQCRDPITSFWTIFGILLVFCVVVWYGVKIIRKKS